MKPVKSKLPQKFLLLSHLKGKTQVKMAQKISMQPSNLNTYLRGNRDIHSRHFVNILRELDIDIEEILNREIASISEMTLEEKLPVGMAFESMIKSLGPTERRTLVRHVIKIADMNLGNQAKSQIQALRGCIK